MKRNGYTDQLQHSILKGIQCCLIDILFCHGFWMSQVNDQPIVCLVSYLINFFIKRSNRHGCQLYMTIAINLKHRLSVSMRLQIAASWRKAARRYKLLIEIGCFHRDWIPEWKTVEGSSGQYYPSLSLQNESPMQMD